jgi:uncharacterized protein YgbK (DUF1537 family)
MIVVIADDLSGATELAAISHAHGLITEVHIDRLYETDSEVVCIDANTRSLPAPNAVAIARRLAHEALDAGCSWIYKKCDSVLRGHVIAETRAIQDATGQSCALLVPANPSRGRTIVDGHYFIHGQPLHETDFANDPVFPRLSSKLADLVGSDLSHITIPDCAKRDSLLRLASAVRPEQLPVGGADFFAALLQTLQHLGCNSVPHWPLASALTRLLVCGSATAWPHRLQLAKLAQVPTATIPADIAVFAYQLTQRRAGLMGLGATVQADSLDQLATAVATTLASLPIDWLLLEGGETAAHVVRKMNWYRFQIATLCDHGLASLKPIGWESQQVLIKPGSYAWPGPIW